MIRTRSGTVYLVGAGPGDPGFITVRGLNCIRKADVIIYDRLSSPRLLTEARRDAEVIYVGKASGDHPVKQDGINCLMIEKARQGRTVVRLKGGDPFIFGRGGEEAEALVQAGVPFEVVPGVTSVVAAPAYAGIPLTRRGLASSIGIVAGNEDAAKGNSSIDWSRIATGTDTLVFLMGMKNLPGIVRNLMNHGRPAGTPVAVVRWGTRTDQATVTGTLTTIEEEVARAGLASPAVIVVGEVVRLRETLRWFECKPLFGRRIAVTRSREQAGALSELIEELGGEALEFPVIRIDPPESSEDLDRAIAGLREYTWVMFTSANGAESFFARLEAAGLDARALGGCRVAAVGSKTADVLRTFGIRADFLPREFRGEAMAEELLARLGPGDRLLLARADIADPALPEALRATGAEVEDVVAYRTVVDLSKGEAIRRTLARRELDAVLFTSGSTVRNFLEILGPQALELMNVVAVACIGPSTARAASEMGLTVHVTPKESTAEGLIGALAEYFGERTGPASRRV